MERPYRKKGWRELIGIARSQNATVSTLEGIVAELHERKNSYALQALLEVGNLLENAKKKQCIQKKERHLLGICADYNSDGTASLNGRQLMLRPQFTDFLATNSFMNTDYYVMLGIALVKITNHKTFESRFWTAFSTTNCQTFARQIICWNGVIQEHLHDFVNWPRVLRHSPGTQNGKPPIIMISLFQTGKPILIIFTTSITSVSSASHGLLYKNPQNPKSGIRRAYPSVFWRPKRDLKYFWDSFTLR